MNKPADCRAILDSAYLARQLARQRLDDSSRALARARQIAGNAHDAVQAAQAAENAVSAAHAARLASAIVSGTDAIPAAVIADDRQRRAAEQRASIADQALTALQKQHTEHQQAASASEQAVVKSVDLLLQAEREDLAANVIRAHRALLDAGDELRASLGDELFLPVNCAIPSSPAIQTALALLPPRDDLHTPVSQLRGALPRRAEAWSARRAALIGGDSVSTTAATAAA